ncbi:hypothetical protein NX02_09700 [Sphingomonas sanxanigenens DSM 19645 = NX02]|uniref:Uncharacterized protein n=1 Tax=Sphingomonas sanxanigenens DSM 19645 = NX02 TaxID=1123269 RepID=W0ADA8_9SPHN|nr:hypothetical protein NX02_09700 [Sphingomonas sanxanigenens DSM 19645 = NX02]
MIINDMISEPFLLTESVGDIGPELPGRHCGVPDDAMLGVERNHVPGASVIADGLSDRFKPARGKQVLVLVLHPCALCSDFQDRSFPQPIGIADQPLYSVVVDGVWIASHKGFQAPPLGDFGIGALRDDVPPEPVEIGLANPLLAKAADDSRKKLVEGGLEKRRRDDRRE